MSQPSKRRPKQPPEPLDWKALASGPALRGLNDVLATPVEVSRERASRRLALETESITPTEGVSPTVVALLDPTVGVSPTEGDTATVVGKPTEGVTPTEGDSNVGSISFELSHLQTPTEGVSPTLTIKPTVGDSPTVGLWIDSLGRTYGEAQIHRVHAAPHSMTPGEERFHQSVWQARESDGVSKDSPRSKVFSMGYDRLAKLVRLDEKSVRQLIPRLIAKKILEVLAGEDSAARIGRTYRIFNHEEIRNRQRSADLQYVAKRGRAVEFVRKATTEGVSPTVGDTPTEVIMAMAEYARPEPAAIRAMVGNCRRFAPDATIEEIVHFIHEKGRVARSAKLSNPLAYLTIYVPKCFQGDALKLLRIGATAP